MKKKLDLIVIIILLSLVIVIPYFVGGSSANFFATLTSEIILTIAGASFAIERLNKITMNTDIIKKQSEYRKYLLKELEAEYSIEQQEKEINGNKKLDAKKNDKRDIIILMLNNNEEITEYFKISKRQAKNSFWFSIIACIIGILMMGLALYAVIEIKDIQFAIIGIIGGTVTELIAGTVLVIHNKSALQLNYYYDALHENERFLSAVNLADKLSDDKKEEMYIDIIKKQIDV